jgi:IS4 transposase
VRTQIADSSTFVLPPAVAQWAQTEPAGDAAGYKLHLRLSGGYGGVAQFHFSPAREHDSPHLNPLVTDLEAGDILLVDRGYLDYGRFDRWTKRGIYFVSKLRKNHSDEVLEEQDLGHREMENGYVLVREQRVRLGSQPREGEAEYRLLDVISPEGKQETLVTNLWDATPEQIVALAQYRWTVEIVFRWLKHTLGLSHLIGTKKEGIEIQLAMALLVYALLVLYQRGHQDWSPKYLLLELNVQLQQAYAAYIYELGRAGLPPPPELGACLPAYA